MNSTIKITALLIACALFPAHSANLSANYINNDNQELTALTSSQQLPPPPRPRSIPPRRSIRPSRQQYQHRRSTVVPSTGGKAKSKGEQSNNKVKQTENTSVSRKQADTPATQALEQGDIIMMVSGEGTTKNEAIANALRSAVEQAYGVFVSANTSILNDELVKDEIATVSSGNIKSYKEIAQVQTTDGHYNVTISATVSTHNLISYSKAHGSLAEFAGQTFAYNMKLWELNKRNEMSALNNMLTQLQSISYDIFNYLIDVQEPQYIEGDKYKIPVTVSVTTTQNYENFMAIISNTLESLSLRWSEIESYKAHNIKCCIFQPFGEKYKKHDTKQLSINLSAKKNCLYFLRNDADSINSIATKISDILNNAQRSFSIDAVSIKEAKYNPWPYNTWLQLADGSYWDEKKIKVSWESFDFNEALDCLFEHEEILENWKEINEKILTITNNPRVYLEYSSTKDKIKPEGVNTVFNSFNHDFEYDINTLSAISSFKATRLSSKASLNHQEDKALLKPFLKGTNSEEEDNSIFLRSNYYYASEDYKNLHTDIAINSGPDNTTITFSGKDMWNVYTIIGHSLADWFMKNGEYWSWRKLTLNARLYSGAEYIKTHIYFYEEGRQKIIEISPYAPSIRNIKFIID